MRQKFQQFDDLMYRHEHAVMHLCFLLQLIFDYGDGRVHCNRCEKGLYLIRCNALPFPQSHGSDLVHKILSLPNVVW